MKDYKLKLRNLHTSHTLGWSWNFEPSNRDEVKEKKDEKKFGKNKNNFYSTLLFSSLATSVLQARMVWCSVVSHEFSLAFL
jgi:hypothetical protein